MAYVLNCLCASGLVMVIAQHVNVTWWECMIMGFSFAWFWGKS